MKLNTFKPNGKVAGPVKSLLVTAIIASATLTAALPAAADNSSTYMGGGAATFERATRDIRTGGQNFYNKYRDKAMDAATKSAVKNGAKQLVTGIAKRTAVGVAVDLAWPKRAE